MTALQDLRGATPLLDGNGHSYQELLPFLVLLLLLLQDWEVYPLELMLGMVFVQKNLLF
jgi:hypothetical protein